MDKSMFKLLAILGGLILLLVVVVFLSNLGNGNKKYSYDELTSEAVKATKKYLSDNSSRKPNRTNQKSTIMLQTLVEENYLKEPADMLKDEDANCYGEINVYYLDEKKYDYIPDIKCTIRNERYYSKNLVNALIGNAEYTDMNVVFIGSGLYKRINNKWIDKDEDLSNFGNDDIVEYYYRGNQDTNIKNYVKIDNMLFRAVMIDNEGDLLLIYNENIQKGSPWDKRYNEDVNKYQGINIYEDNGVKSNALMKVESFISGEEKLENKIKMSSSLKYIVKNMDLCMGKRKPADVGTDGEIECKSMITDQKAGLLPAYMFMSASIDPTCEKVEDKACGNNNYLASFSNSYWLLTANEEESNQCFYVNKNISSTVCSANNSFKPIVKVTGRIQYKEGTGTKNDPYVVNNTYYKTETEKKK